MKAKEILKNVCVYLGKEELLASSLFEENGNEPTEREMADINKMLKCLNFITSEIASDYLPIIKEKEVEITNHKINVFDIDEKIQEIVSFKSVYGRNLKYRLIDGHVVSLTNKAVVKYKVYPDEILLDGNAETFGGRLSARIIAYGVASEYCFLEMLYDDASIWENRYKNALLMNSRKKSEITLKKRGWF